MEREEFEALGFWERHVASSKLWEELKTPVHSVKDQKGRISAQAKVRKTNWSGYWLFQDDEGFQLLEDSDVRGWVLEGGG